MESADGLKQLLEESGIALESGSAHQLLGYLALLEKWGSRMNLTASTEWPALEHLFREGIWVSKIYPPEAVSHLDIGSGAGFPAVLLKILVPRIQLEMVEIRAKKGAFLETVAEMLGMQGTFVHVSRLEDYLRRCEFNKVWDCVSWKGLRLRGKDLVQLRAHTHQGTRLWIFHGKELAIEHPAKIEESFKALGSERLPGRKGSWLSTFIVASNQ